MRWSDLPLNPSARMLRQFAGLWMAFFGGLAAWHFFRRPDHGHAFVLAVLAVSVGPVGLVAPSFVRPIFVTWTVLAFPIGWVVSRLLLLLLFCGIVTPIALLFRVTGRDPLRRRIRGRDTYWLPKPAPADVASYYRQY
jgi:polyferredoxin